MKRVAWFLLLALLLTILTLTGCRKAVDPPGSNAQLTATDAVLQTGTEMAADTDHAQDIVLESDESTEASEPADTSTEAVEPNAPDTTAPQSSEPGSEPEPTRPAPTEPMPTEPEPTQPQPTEQKPTEPAPTTHTHRYTASTVEPTCTAQGYTLHSCACGDSYKDSYTAALGHDYRDTVVAPTASAQGYTLHTCSRCGDSYRDSYTDPVRWDTPERVAQVCADLNAYISSIGLTVDPNAEGWTSPQVTSYYTESEFRSRMIEFINWYKEQGFTNLRVTYESNGDGSYTFYVKYNIVSG